MKPKDFRSIESILKEYSMKPGRTPPTPVKDLGLNVAKATASKAKELQNIAKHYKTLQKTVENCEKLQKNCKKI